MDLASKVAQGSPAQSSQLWSSPFTAPGSFPTNNSCCPSWVHPPKPTSSTHPPSPPHQETHKSGQVLKAVAHTMHVAPPTLPFTYQLLCSPLISGPLRILSLPLLIPSLWGLSLPKCGNFSSSPPSGMFVLSCLASSPLSFPYNILVSGIPPDIPQVLECWGPPPVSNRHSKRIALCDLDVPTDTSSTFPWNSSLACLLLPTKWVFKSVALTLWPWPMLYLVAFDWAEKSHAYWLLDNRFWLLLWERYFSREKKCQEFGKHC